MTDRQAEVFMRVDGQDLPVGRLYAHARHGAESATFRYADEWLGDRRGFAIDPALGLFSGPIQTPQTHRLFGAFSDCAPDRWGRRLIERQERLRAHVDAVTPRSFTEFDYLMRVRDDGRQGALRFLHPHTDRWAAGPDGFPHLTDLPQLLRAARNVQEGADTAEDLSLLVAAGSSLGGARPKAHVLKDDGRLAIAKFPSTQDEDYGVVPWEQVALRLAREAGVTAATSRLIEVEGAATPVLLVDRFDREAGERVGYISAMTALEATDHDNRSYVEIAQFLEPVSSTVEADLHELWRRLVFGILVSNTDDHLRNHGFLRRRNGWQLAPAFDLNPNPSANARRFSTAIGVGSGDRNTIEEALAQAAHFRLDERAAAEIVGEVTDGVSGWRDVAGECGITSREIAFMAPAFEHDQLERARHVSR